MLDSGRRQVAGWTRISCARSGLPSTSQQQKLVDASDDKGNADVIEGMEVQGLAIPAHGKISSAAAWLDDYLASSQCCSLQSSDR